MRLRQSTRGKNKFGRDSDLLEEGVSWLRPELAGRKLRTWVPTKLTGKLLVGEEYLGSHPLDTSKTHLEDAHRVSLKLTGKLCTRVTLKLTRNWLSHISLATGHCWPPYVTGARTQESEEAPFLLHCPPHPTVLYTQGWTSWQLAKEKHLQGPVSGSQAGQSLVLRYNC